MPAGLRFSCALLALCAACNIDNPGDAPARATLYFPNALALSQRDGDAAPRYLYVANSNFDLRYKGGSVQAYSLDRVQAELGRCRDNDCIIETADVFEDEVLVSSFSTALAVSGKGESLLLTTRTTDSLSAIDANADADGDDVLDCGGIDRAAVCDQSAERNANRFRDEDDDRETLEWPIDPMAVTSGPLTDWLTPEQLAALGDDELPEDSDEYALVAHRNGQVSLFVEIEGELTMTDVFANGAFGATDIAFDSVSKLAVVTLYQVRRQRALGRFGVIIPSGDGGALDLDRATIYDAGPLVLQAVDSFRDTRAIAFVPTPEGETKTGQLAVIAAQEPSSLLLVDLDTPEANALTGNLPQARVKDLVVVGAGAARVATGLIGDLPIAVVSSFDSREVAIVDLRTMRTRSVIPNLSGPFSVVIDDARMLAYFTDFRSSVLRILDLSSLLDEERSEPIEVAATLGKPRVLQELQ